MCSAASGWSHGRRERQPDPDRRPRRCQQLNAAPKIDDEGNIDRKVSASERGRWKTEMGRKAVAGADAMMSMTVYIHSP